MKFRHLTLALLLAPTLLVAAENVRGSAEAGAAVAATCGACHGVAGANSLNPEWPNLAGQNANYIVHQLRMYHHGKRAGDPNAAVMLAQSATLTDQQMDDVAAYFATLAPAGLESPAGSFEAGARLYQWGDATRGIPACAACHGPVGRGNPAAGYPALRAQQSVYVLKQLKAYAADARYTLNEKGATSGGDTAAIMNTVAKRLSDEDKAALAAYVQALR